MPKRPRVELPDDVREFFQQAGSVGGYIAAANMSKKARHARAIKGAKARIAKAKKERR